MQLEVSSDASGNSLRAAVIGMPFNVASGAHGHGVLDSVITSLSRSSDSAQDDRVEVITAYSPSGYSHPNNRKIPSPTCARTTPPSPGASAAEVMQNAAL
jgi:hypothetical protein